MGVILALVLALTLQDPPRPKPPPEPETLEQLVARFTSEAKLAAAKRYATLWKIGALRTEDAADFLTGVFEMTDDDPAVRSYALTALGNCGTTRGFEKLRSVVKEPLHELRYRSSALYAMASTRWPKALTTVLEIASDESAKNTLRITACAALQQFPLSETEKFWRQALDDNNLSIIGYAMRALAPLKDPHLLARARRILEQPGATVFLKPAAVEVWKPVGGVEMTKLFLAAGASADGPLRKQLLLALGTLTDEKAIEVIWDAGLKDPLPAVRALAARALGRLKHAKAFDALEDALRDKEPEVRSAVIDAIAELHDAKSEHLLRREAQKSDEHTAAAAVGALASFRSKDTFDLLVKIAGRSRVAPAVAAIEALGQQGQVEAMPTLEKALRAKEWPVRSAAIRALARLRFKESIDLLVERLGKEEGRLQADIAGALGSLTGKALGYEQILWKAWWDAQREKFVFTDRAEGVVQGGSTTTTYHGVPILSKRIIFVLDISGSMSAAVGEEKVTRLEQAKEELSRVLKSLDRSSMINMIFFDDRFDAWQRQLVSLGAYLPKALDAVRALSPRGGTNIYDPLELALTDPNVDTIFLLSDGSPGSGKYIDTEEILREVRKINRVRQVSIHTISLGVSPFMKSLAEQNGGTYVEKK